MKKSSYVEDFRTCRNSLATAIPQDGGNFAKDAFLPFSSLILSTWHVMKQLKALTTLIYFSVAFLCA